MSYKFLKEMAAKYGLVYVEEEKSLYIQFNPSQSNADYQVMMYDSLNREFSIYPECVIWGSHIFTNSDRKTWITTTSVKKAEKAVIQFVDNYKKALVKQKLNKIKEDFE
jgi:hypothetical protein